MARFHYLSIIAYIMVPLGIVTLTGLMEIQASEFLYEQNPSYWNSEESYQYDDIVTSEYERMIQISKKSDPNIDHNYDANTDGDTKANANRNNGSDNRNSNTKTNADTLPLLTHTKNTNVNTKANVTGIHDANYYKDAINAEYTLDSLLDLDPELMPMLESLTSDAPFYYDDALDYIDYPNAGDIFDSPLNNSALSAMIAQLIHNPNCTESGDGKNHSVMCCTFSMDDNTTHVSTICSNETKVPGAGGGGANHHHHGHHRNPTKPFCPKHAWESILKLICVPTLCAFGLCGNTISFLVMCSGAYRRKSYGHYLRALAVFDNLTLIINLVFTANDITFSNRDIGLHGNVTYIGLLSFHTSLSCKVTEFMRHVVYLMSSWLVVCFTVDRFIAVCFPLLRVRYCTERSAIVTTITLLVAVMLSQAYHLVFIERLDRDLNPHFPCHANPDPSVRLTYFGLNYFWFSFLLRFTLPFIAIAMCNGCIIYHIARVRKGRRSKETRRTQKASLAIYTLYAVCLCFVITVLPNAIVSIIQFSSFFANQRNLDTGLYCALRTVYTPLHVLRLVNYSANCVLYGIAGRQFRQELYKLFWCCVGRNSYDKRSIQSPEPIALKADLLLTSRKHGNTVIRMK